MTTATAPALTRLSPVQIDTQIAAIHTRYWAVRDQIATQEKYLASTSARIVPVDEGGAYHERTNQHLSERVERLTKRIAALTEQAEAILEEADPLQAEYRRRGRWNRFFLVQNNGGHIHSSMRCSTCNKMGKATRFGWLPNLSGQDDVAAAAVIITTHGSIFCTTCFPDAPVSWTNGAKPADKDICSGSGRYYDAALPSRTGYYSGNWATCSQCHARQSITSAYKIRKHKTPQN